MTIARLMAAEIFIIIVSSTVLCALLIVVVSHFSNDLVRMAFIR
jgi:hypothetical protein